VDAFQIPGLTGLPAFVGALVLMGLYVHFSSKITKDKTLKEAEKRAKEANKETIESMQKHIDSLKERMGEAEKDNMKLKHLFDTVNAALKARGLYVAVDGDMIHLHETHGTSTTIHISGASAEKEE